MMLEAIGVLDQLRSVVGFKLRVAGQGDLQLALGEGLVEVIGRASGADHIKATLHNTTRNVSNLVNIFRFQQPTISGQECFVDEVVILDAGKGQAVLVRPVCFLGLLPAGGHQSGRSALPHRPSWSGRAQEKKQV